MESTSTSMNLEEKSLCPCIRCKYQVPRKRRICNEHVKKWGVFPIERLEPLLSGSNLRSSHDEALSLQPEWGPRARGSTMQSENEERTENEEFFEADMDDMIDAFYITDHIQEPEPDRPEELAHDLSSHLQERRTEQTSKEEAELKRLARLPLYRGARISVLRTCLSILNLQSIFGWSDTSVSKLFADMVECPKCGKSRYRQDVQGERVPAKVLRHFPIIPRIQTMFKCKRIASLMSWHQNTRSSDNIMRVPADSPAWKHIEEKWEAFKNEPRNIRFGLAMDGVNPFGLRSSTWSTWPICLVNYNLPPWLAIKKGHILLSLIVPGKYKVKNMDVYLRPLVEEFEELWTGIRVHDMSKRFGQRDATIRGMLMWTMHDWPGYGEASGFTYSGLHACPMCGPRLDARYSKPLRKIVYEGHRAYLPEDHPMREGFLGKPPSMLGVSDWKHTWDLDPSVTPPGMKRLSIFHVLPYWGDLLINHLIDPMHIFKNVAVVLWKTIIGDKETKGQRDDLQEQGRMHNLWAQSRENRKVLLPKSPWVLTKNEEKQVKKCIQDFRTPTGCMHSLKGAFTKDDELSGLKSHDWHKFLQFVLPVAIKGCLSDDIQNTIYKISALVRWISQKEIAKDTLESARLNSLEALAMVEKFFPSSVLTIQMHLLVHVVDEVQVAGTVHSRWMFFLERFMKTLKGFVRQRARPEGSMAMGWLVQESLVHITEFLVTVDPDMPRLWSQDEDDRMLGEEPQGKGKVRTMDVSMRDKINKFCILNSQVMQKWIAKYDEERKERDQARQRFRRNRTTRMLPYPADLAHLPEFPTGRWLDQAIQQAKNNGDIISDEEQELAYGCDRHYRKFGALWSRGRHFRVEHIDKKRTTFDCGVKASFEQEINMSSTSDQNTQNSKLEYFGTIQDIIKVGFRKFDMFIFDVRWFKVVTQGQQATIRRDKSGLIQVDSTKVWTDQRDTFVLPEHCEQIVFKVDPREPRWLFVIEVAPRKRQIFEGVEIEEEILETTTIPNDGSGLVQGHDGVNVQEQPYEEPQEDAQPFEEVHEGTLIDLQEPVIGVPNEEGLYELEMDDDHEFSIEDDPEMDGPRMQLQLEGDSDEDEVSPINDEDGEIFLEIDLLGTRDLNDDERIDDEL